MFASKYVRPTARKLSVFFLLCATAASASSAPLDDPSGETVAVVQAASASGPGGRRTLAPEKPIYSGDRIKTGDIGSAQIRFRDNTRFVVGPRSSVVIDKFIFNPNRTLAGASMKMARGAFRFISGRGPKKAYKIATPTATLGIRGTEVDVAVSPRLGTAVLVFKGAVQLCSRRSGRCTIVRSGCGAAVASPDGVLRSPRTSGDKLALIRSSFPLTSRQERLRRPFRVSIRGCGRLGKPRIKEPAETRRASLAPINAPPPPNTGGNPPSSRNAPGASGRTPGGSNSSFSSASDNARSEPGQSASSNAGGNANGNGNGNSNGNGNGNGNR